MVDAGHFGTEKHVPGDLKAYLESEARAREETLSVWTAEESDAFWPPGSQ